MIPIWLGFIGFSLKCRDGRCHKVSNPSGNGLIICCGNAGLSVLRANYIIAWAWTGAALLMMIGNIALIYVPSLPLWSSLLIAFAARNSAVYFTKWYPEYRRVKYGPPPANALPGTN